MQKTVEHFFDQLHSISDGLATPGLIGTYKVEYYGQQAPIAHLAQVCGGDGRITIMPHDSTLLKEIEKVLKGSGHNAYVFNKTSVAVILPKWVSSADRDRAISQVRKLAEEAKVAIRSIRKAERKKIDLPEDQQRQAEKQLQEQTDACVKQIDDRAEQKIKAMLEG